MMGERPAETDPSRIVWKAALEDPTFVAALEEGIADFAAGRVHDWADVKRRYFVMTEEQVQTPKPGEEPKPPEEPTEPPLESEDDPDTAPEPPTEEGT